MNRTKLIAVGLVCFLLGAGVVDVLASGISFSDSGIVTTFGKVFDFVNNRINVNQVNASSYNSTYSISIMPDAFHCYAKTYDQSMRPYKMYPQSYMVYTLNDTNYNGGPFVGNLLLDGYTLANKSEWVDDFTGAHYHYFNTTKWFYSTSDTVRRAAVDIGNQTLIIRNISSWKGQAVVFQYNTGANISFKNKVYAPLMDGGIIPIYHNTSTTGSQGGFLWGEYPASGNTSYIHVYRFSSSNSTIYSVLNVTGGGHFHCVLPDLYYDGIYYACEGDSNASVHWYYSRDWGKTWGTVTGSTGSQQFRTIGVVTDKDYVYWSMDGSVNYTNGKCYFFRAPKNATGIVDMSKRQILYTFSYPIISYGVIRSFDPPGVVVTTHVDSGTVTKLPILFYDSDRNVTRVLTYITPLAGASTQYGVTRISNWQSMTDGTFWFSVDKCYIAGLYCNQCYCKGRVYKLMQG